MHGMVISMSFAMNIGLTIGVLFGSLHQGNLFLSTIISMFAGLLVGLLCGIGLGLLPTIEGTMSGIMGGMMGAMLGEMIKVTQSSVMLSILLTFSLCSLLFLVLPNKDNQVNKIYNWLWFLKPMLLIVILSSYLLFGFNLSKDVAWNSQKDNGLSGQHSQNFNNETFIKIETLGFKYTPASFDVKKGNQVSLILNNVDTIEHDLEIKGKAKVNLNLFP